jgi:ketosteroid isomerase-like protein
MSDERKVQEVLARYVRATDRRDGKRLGALYTDDATGQIFAKTGHDVYQPIGEPNIDGSGVEYAVENFMAPHREGGSSHDTTSDHVIEVDGDRAHMNAQFVVFEVRATSRPAAGWPEAPSVSRAPSGLSSPATTTPTCAASTESGRSSGATSYWTCRMWFQGPER